MIFHRTENRSKGFFRLSHVREATAKWSERLRQRGEDYKDANVRCRVGWALSTSQILRNETLGEEDLTYGKNNCLGVHHGECVGGIVGSVLRLALESLLVGACWGPGTGMMRYHLFGEFMSIVDILEATSKEGVCQISDACRTVAAAN